MLSYATDYPIFVRKKFRQLQCWRKKLFATLRKTQKNVARLHAQNPFEKPYQEDCVGLNLSLLLASPTVNSDWRLILTQVCEVDGYFQFVAKLEIYTFLPWLQQIAGAGGYLVVDGSRETRMKEKVCRSITSSGTAKHSSESSHF